MPFTFWAFRPQFCDSCVQYFRCIATSEYSSWYRLKSMTKSMVILTQSSEQKWKTALTNLSWRKLTSLVPIPTRLFMNLTITTASMIANNLALKKTQNQIHYFYSVNKFCFYSVFFLLALRSSRLYSSARDQTPCISVWTNHMNLTKLDLTPRNSARRHAKISCS